MKKINNYSWEQRKLGDITVRVNRQSSYSDAPIMMISTPANGFVLQSQHYAFDNTGLSLSKYILLKEGELAYNHGASKLRPYGSCFDLKIPAARIPFVYIAFSVKEHDPSFISYALNLARVQRELRKMISSTARMDGLLNISFEQYMSLMVKTPLKSEERKIACFIKHLETIITLHQRK